MSRFTNRRLVTEADIVDAAIWRLAAWSPEEIEAGTLRLVRLFDQGVSLESEHPAVAELLATLDRPGERREAWTALCALAVLHADAYGDAALCFRAGFDLIGSYRQAMRGLQTRSDDDLDRLIAQYLGNHPKATATEIFEHFVGLADFRMVIVEASGTLLTYHPEASSERLSKISRHALEMRVSRARKQMASRPAAAREIFPAWLNPQPVVVNSA